MNMTMNMTMDMGVNRTNNSETNPSQKSNGKNIECICLHVIGDNFYFH